MRADDDMYVLPVFCHECVVDESFHEQGEGDDIEDEDVEDALSVVLEVSGEHVPLLEEPVSVSLCNSVHCKTLHSCNVRVGIQVVLSGSLAVQSYGQHVALKQETINTSVLEACHHLP